MPPVATLVQPSGVVAAAAQPDLADSSQQQQQDYGFIEQLGQRLLQQQQQQQQDEGAGSVSPAPEPVYLAVKLKGGRVRRFGPCYSLLHCCVKPTATCCMLGTCPVSLSPVTAVTWCWLTPQTDHMQAGGPVAESLL